MDDVAIEVEQPADHAAIERVVRAAFADEPQVADMVAAIRVSPRFRPGLAFVARAGGDVVGSVMLSGVDLVDGAGARREVLCLTPLAVQPGFQRRGIGAALVATAIRAADRRGEPLVVVEGSPRYYGRLGFDFAPARGIHIDLPDWAPPEAAQVQLLAAYDPKLKGRVEYPPAIAAVSG